MRDKYAMTPPLKNGYAHERARHEIRRRITDFEANPSSDEFMPGSPDEQAGARVSKARKKTDEDSNL